jgi:hypothetical protein
VEKLRLTLKIKVCIKTNYQIQQSIQEHTKVDIDRIVLFVQWSRIGRIIRQQRLLQSFPRAVAGVAKVTEYQKYTYKYYYFVHIFTELLFIIFFFFNVYRFTNLW